jgi:hypothetical protein
MSVYTVHAPAAAGEEPDRFTFVRDGFHIWALVFGPLWLIWHRLWLVLIGYLVVSFGLGVMLSVLNAGATARSLVFFLLALLMGLEAASLRRWSYSRSAWRQIDFVVADDEETAERRFFDRWTADRAETSSPHDGLPPYPQHRPASAGPAAPQGIIGLFPEPGGSR